ncbi:hypothetical protein IJT10_06735 [bacterium]|nr:hypothetical protein [bacterium]
MTLLITVFAAVFSTAYWYAHAPKDEMKVDILCWLYWGASLMWLVDALFEYWEEGAKYFTPVPANMLNDAYLGLAVVALGLVIWIVRLLILDPKGAIKALLLDKSNL